MDTNNNGSTNSKLDGPLDGNVRGGFGDGQKQSDMSVRMYANDAKPAPYDWPGEGSPANTLTAHFNRTRGAKDGDEA